MAAHLGPEQQSRALSLQRRCWTHERIAADLGVHQTTVSRFLARHNRRALARLERRTATLKAQQVAQLEWMAEEAARQWERSVEDAESIQETVGGGPNGDKTVTTIEPQTGDPRLLKEAREALREVRDILGIDPRLDLQRAKLPKVDVAVETKPRLIIPGSDDRS